MKDEELDESNWSEGKIQSKSFQWHYKEYPDLRGLLFTVDNNAVDGVKGAVRLAMGRVAGVSDMIYLYRGTCYLIEFKTPTGKQSEKQIQWQLKAKEHYFTYFVVSSFKEFKRLIRYIHENY